MAHLQRLFVVVLGLCGSFATPMAPAAIVNGDFEAGLAGWNQYGYMAATGPVSNVAPAQGALQAFINSGRFDCYACFSPPPPGTTTIDDLDYSNIGVPGGIHNLNQRLGAIAPYGVYLNSQFGALTQTFNAAPGSLLTFAYDAVSGSGGSGSWECGSLDYGAALVNGVPFNLCVGGQTLPTGVTPVLDLQNNKQFGVPLHAGYREFALTLDNITPQLYPGLSSPGYLLAFIVGQGVDPTLPTGLLIDNVRLQAVPEPNSALLLSVALALYWLRRPRGRKLH